MITITKEWLQSQISAIEAVGITDSNTLEAFKLALASLEADPVAWIWRWSDDEEGLWRYSEDRKETKGSVTAKPLFTAPPAPGSVPDIKWPEDKFCPAEYAGSQLWEETEIWNKAIDACKAAFRAAMLHGAEPVTTAYKLPDGWVAVPVEPTKEMIDSGWSYYMTKKSPSSLGVYGAMLAAAPQQEA
ncbi:hypothetical protein FPF80_01110 [Salmonella enterica subsp. enterica]|nr:hypothetical protein [Salmonella enterica subsp. enterica serovar Typhimurium]ECH1286373.1 hypothetical protein [Salmonella enterica subsp. enterica serovar Typhimurium]ECK0317836.1 hypothetical protein [Salmonella enterica subsp. enterica serovar Typhimurium]ECR1804276.1 hypothetical protein [Salmonella enterica subsp. enterica serovar Typhimurium]